MAEEGANPPQPEEQEGANPPQDPTPEEKAPDQNPYFPEQAGDVPTGEEKVEEDVDPEIKEIREDPKYKEFVERAKTPEMMYKRYTDSSAEALRLKQQAEQAEQYRENYEAVRRDFDIMRQANPELYNQVVDLFQKLQNGEVSTPNQPEQKEEMSEEKMQKIAELQTTLSEFKNEHKDVIKGDDDLKQIRNFAASLAGKTDRDGNHFTYRQALAAGLQYYHPEVLTDQAKMEAMASIEQRSSASESGNSPTGSSPKTRNSPLTAEEKRVAENFGMTDAEYRKFEQG